MKDLFVEKYKFAERIVSDRKKMYVLFGSNYDAIDLANLYDGKIDIPENINKLSKMSLSDIDEWRKLNIQKQQKDEKNN